MEIVDVPMPPIAGESVCGTSGRRKRAMGVREAKRCKVREIGFIYLIFERVGFMIPILIVE